MFAQYAAMFAPAKLDRLPAQGEGVCTEGV